MTSKDEALHKALKVLNCLNNDKVYETAWVKGAINACEEALEQPAWQGLTDDEREMLYDKAIEMPLANLWNDYAYLIEQALKDKNT